MADNVYTPVVFNEGAPLDPNDLMTLQNAIVSIKASTDTLKSSLEAGSTSYTVVSDFGQDSIKVPAAGAVSAAKDLTNPMLSNIGDGKLNWIVSLASPLAAKQNITLTVVQDADGKNAKLYAVGTNAKTMTVKFNWLCSVKKYK